MPAPRGALPGPPGEGSAPRRQRQLLRFRLPAPGRRPPRNGCGAPASSAASPRAPRPAPPHWLPQPSLRRAPPRPAPQCCPLSAVAAGRGGAGAGVLRRAAGGGAAPAPPRARRVRGAPRPASSLRARGRVVRRRRRVFPRARLHEAAVERGGVRRPRPGGAARGALLCCTAAGSAADSGSARPPRAVPWGPLKIVAGKH